MEFSTGSLLQSCLLPITNLLPIIARLQKFDSLFKNCYSLCNACKHHKTLWSISSCRKHHRILAVPMAAAISMVIAALFNTSAFNYGVGQQVYHRVTNPSDLGILPNQPGHKIINDHHGLYLRGLFTISIIL